MTYAQEALFWIALLAGVGLAVRPLVTPPRNSPDHRRHR